MERSIFSELIKWKNKKNRKPLILQGARQVGKTWIMREFGRLCYENMAYINLDNNPAMKTSFSIDRNVHRIMEDISIQSGSNIMPDKTLIILDEIQEVPDAISCLKYFCEEAADYHVIVAGSLLGVAIQKGISYPVGKVDVLNMYPLSFAEFLNALGENELSSYSFDIESDKNLTFREKYLELLKKYYFVGGMPEAVLTYVNEKDYAGVRQIQTNIIRLYENDFSKHIENKTELERTRLVWNSIPVQLAKENKKFFFSRIKKGARSKDFEVSIQWLVDCGLAYRVFCVSKPAVPLKAYAEFSAYKLFFLDVGLLCAMSELDAKSLLEGNRIFVEFKGSLTEQYVLQELKVLGKYTPYYYSNENSTNEIDFLIQQGMDAVPIEVKAEENLRSKSLKAFVEKYDIPNAIRFSMSSYKNQAWLTNIPLWNVCGI